MSAAVSYSYSEKSSILDYRWVRRPDGLGVRQYLYPDELVELHRKLREQYLKQGVIRRPGILKMTDEDHHLAAQHIQQGYDRYDRYYGDLPVYEQDPGYAEIAEILWGDEE